MVELADTLDLGSSAKACRFKSCRAHQTNLFSLSKEKRFLLLAEKADAIKRRNNVPIYINMGVYIYRKDVSLMLDLLQNLREERVLLLKKQIQELLIIQNGIRFIL